MSFINQVRIKLNGFETYIKIKLKYFKENTCIICITKMNCLLDTMFIKRFCLPYDSDINLYENGECNVSSYVCGHYNHISCLLQGKWRFEEG